MYFEYRFGPATNCSTIGDQWIGMPLNECGHRHRTPSAAYRCMVKDKMEHMGAVYKITPQGYKEMTWCEYACVWRNEEIGENG
jgi:hypothetical protein